MKIAILGSGVVGKTLGAALGRHGHEVVLGSGSPDREDLGEWSQQSGQRVASFADAAADGELVVLALNGAAALDVVGAIGPDAFAGKVVVDATNPLAYDTGRPELSVTGADSLGERIQARLPGAHVVKAYNTVGATLMVDPHLPGGPPTMLIAGNETAAKQTVEDLLRATGWDTADLGDITRARDLEALAIVWISYGLRSGGWQHAFRLLR